MNTAPEIIRASYDRIYGQLEDIVRNCPDELWAKKTGGYLFWQQLYHVFAIIALFTGEGGRGAGQSLFPDSVARLLEETDRTPSRDELLAACQSMRQAAHAYLDSLTPEKLEKRHDNRSQRYGREVTVFEAMLMLIGHGYYHIGACDAALRDAGYPGNM